MSSKIQVTWQNPNESEGKTFIYRSRESFTEDNLPPEPLAVINNPDITVYEDYDVREGEAFYYMLAYGENMNRVFSPIQHIRAVYANNNPYALSVQVVDGQYHLSWGYARLIGAGFNLYNEDRPINNGLDAPKVRNIQALAHSGPINVRRKNYFKVGIVKSGVEYFSNEAVVLTQYPYNLAAQISDGQLQLSWAYDSTLYDSFKYYCSDAPMDPASMPEPKLIDVQTTSLVDLVDFNTRQYMRIGVMLGEVEYLSDEISFLGAPYDVKTVLDGGALISTWKSEQPNFSYFNYYCADFPIDPENPPVPKLTGFKAKTCTDLVSDVNGTKYVRIGIVVDGIEYMSPEYVYGNPAPYGLVVDASTGELAISWQFDHADFEYFNYYAAAEPIRSLLPEPVATGITALNHIDPDGVYGRKYICIGVVRDGMEYLSNEVFFSYDRPYAVHAANILGQFGTRWIFDGLSVESFNYYRESVPIDPANLPAARATAIDGAARIYLDPDAGLFGVKYVRIGAVVNGVEQLSEQFVYGYSNPYQLDVSTQAEAMHLAWAYDRDAGAGFNVYLAPEPLDPDNLPAPLASGVVSPFNDPGQVYGIKHVMIGMPRAGRLYLSEPAIYRYPGPYNVTAQVQQGQALIQWQHDHDAASVLNYYCATAPMDPAIMPAPKAANLSGLEYTDLALDTAVVNYVRIGLVRDGQEYLSSEIVTQVIVPPEPEPEPEPEPAPGEDPPP